MTALLVISWTASAAASSGWAVARTAHFEVYSQAGPDTAESALAWFEQLRAFFDRNGLLGAALRQERRPPLKVIGFSSRKEYSSFKVRATADAFYTGTADRDYIVMSFSGPEEFRIAAHEYAHFALHAGGLKLPAWLNEGLAEYFSTVRITRNQCQLGGQLPARWNTLRHSTWLPASKILAFDSAPLIQDRQDAAVYYAESWAVTDMLISSPDYASHFGDLVSALNTGLPTYPALAKTYGKSPDLILSETEAWVTRGMSAKRTLPLLASEKLGTERRELSRMQTSALLGEVLLATGKWDRAQQIFTNLLGQSRENPHFLASLGAIALYKGDRLTAVAYWRRALDGGIRDASLCYRYALLAEEAGLPSQEIAGALQQAILNQPDFDDARYRLALLKSNAGDFATAVEQLKAMARPSAQRALAYWTALSYALAELGNREEAESAAQQAFGSATTAAEQARATELKYVAKTDLTVQFVRTPEGQLQLVTTRVPHGSTDWNPFIEAGERVQTATGKLQEVKCDAGVLTGLVVEGASGRLTLSVPYPTHVLIRNGPSEYSCGLQSTLRDVTIEFATRQGTNSLLRGMQFHDRR